MSPSCTAQPRLDVESRTQQEFPRASLWLRGYHPSPTDKFFSPKERKKTSRHIPEKTVCLCRRTSSCFVLRHLISGNWFASLYILAGSSWALLHKGHRRIEISFAWKQMPIKITGERQKEKKLLTGVVNTGKMLGWSQSLQKPFVLLFPKQLLPWSFPLCVQAKTWWKELSWAHMDHWRLWQGCSSLSERNVLLPPGSEMTNVKASLAV